ncbi:hypothetical protein [Flavobacterium fluviatile]|uniref:hypothetical protein n=1 Tax=Flavobacterium fluviatile TaxID=1862387 RepID=UPI0013D2E3F4|nr:hypothetical protein [Flavobacterium fluviatile]
MKKYIYSIMVLLLAIGNVQAQAPNWSVNENNFQYTMTFVGFLNVDGTTLASANDKVAAFVGNECRGVANLTYVASQNKYFAYLTVFSNQNNETISFKIYNSAKNEIKNVEKTKNFITNENYGNLFQAYSFASPALSTEAGLLNISFKNVQNKDIAIEGNTITVYLDAGQDLTALNTVFQLSPGAGIYMGTVKQESGANTISYTNPVQFQVLSADQSVLKQWTVTVKKGSGNVVYYKKDAVCYEGGAIKLLHSKEGESVRLMTGTLALSTQTIANGQVVFNNLNEGTYKVVVDGDVKEIVINLKK